MPDWRLELAGRQTPATVDKFPPKTNLPAVFTAAWQSNYHIKKHPRKICTGFRGCFVLRHCRKVATESLDLDKTWFK